MKTESNLSQYTKGEWEYTEELRANFSMISGTEEVVCGLPNPIPSDNYDKELIQMRANAHLIAAAPDMYQACKAYFRWLYKEDNYPSLTQIDALFEKALIKAEGK